MAEIIEGYKAPASSAVMPTSSGQLPISAPAAGPQVSTWIDGLRADLRREMIRELAMRRIRSGGRENQPSVNSSSRTERMVEAFFVGVAVTLASTWLCTIASRNRNGDE